ncbi:MAG: sugar ABC transporter permease [Sphaerochaeta sp.]|nr:sugar ABC transporter permease [Sphaerochaeta sp.]
MAHFSRKRTVHSMSIREKRDLYAFVGFTAPTFILLGIFIFWPIFYSFYLSLFKWNMISPRKTFLGFQNYRDMYNDPVFWLVVKNTLLMAFFTVIVKMAISLYLASQLNKKVKGSSVYRAIIFSPTFTANVAIAMVWAWIFEPTYGLLRVVLKPLGFPMIDWIHSTSHSLPAVIIVLIWSGIGYDMVLFLAALKNISLEIYDAALVDGANSYQIFWRITFPLISPTTFFLLITGFINVLKAFDIVRIMTEGGPLNSSNVVVHFLYQNAFQWFRTGYASALALILFVFIMFITLIQNRLSKRWVHY